MPAFAGPLDVFRPCAPSLRSGGRVTRKISNASLAKTGVREQKKDQKRKKG
jgi:hypothetical protein